MSDLPVRDSQIAHKPATLEITKPRDKFAARRMMPEILAFLGLRPEVCESCLRLEKELEELHGE